MDKILFTNGQQPALNDTNLNLLQDNIEKAINAVLAKITPVILFQGSTQDDFVLSDEINNYKKVTIYYKDNDGSRYSRTFENTDASNEFTVALDGKFNSSGYYNTKLRMYRISGKNVNGTGQANFNYIEKSVYYDNSITVTRVEGYK
jgi:hypothetical protein